MIKRISIVLAMILISYEIIFSGTDVFPKVELLWQKKFDKEINSIAVNSDTTRIALIMHPLVKKIKDDSYYTLSEHPEFRNPDGSYYKSIRYYCYGSKLYYLDNYGNILWTYEHDKEMNLLSDVVMSEDGKYIACAVMELNHYEIWMQDDSGKKSLKKIQYWEYKEILFFNSKGKLLWSFKATGIPEISSDGNYVFIIPMPVEGTEPDNYYLLDKTGKKLWEMKGIEEPQYAFMSKDGKYFAIDNTLYDNKKNVLLQLNKFLRTDEDVYFGGISKDGSIGMVELSRPGRPRRWIKLFCVDLKNKKILWKKEATVKEVTKYDSKIYRYPFGRYYFSKDNKYLITDEVGIYDLISGKIVSKWEGGGGRGEIRINDKSYLVDVEGYTDLYFYEMFTGRTQKMLSLPDLLNWGMIKITENNKYMLIRIKENLYLYEIK